MNTYTIAAKDDGSRLEIAFGDPGTNDVIVREANAQLLELKASGQLPGGPLMRVNGPASLPVAMVISHHLVHLYESVAVFDPKLAKYVVVSAHGRSCRVGDLID